jgi:hypothetical protein
VEYSFLNFEAIVLQFKVGSLPFLYLSLSVGSNPRKVSTWDSMIKVVEGRLKSWRNIYASFGRQMVMILSVLISIPIFYFSFFMLIVVV